MMTTIHELRCKQGMTQVTLAKQLNVSQSTIAMWESGARKPDIVMLKRLADILGCTTDELLKPITI